MRTKIIGKAAVSLVVVFVLSIASAQAMNESTNTKTMNPTGTEGWYMKPAYPNYAPQGLPDFSQQQDQWKKISPGPNGIIDSTVAGDDIYNVEENCIAPGLNCHLDSNITGDDITEWIFCGPVAVANCFWWFDSKYADPEGTPGDGEDQFALVENYGAGDDHASANAPLLIEKLARAMNTTGKGTTYIGDMYSAIVDWLDTTDLSDKFTVQTQDRPEFSFIEDQIEQSQNVILLLGSYDLVVGPLVVDQSQINGPLPELCKVGPWIDYQEFIPNVPRIDAVQILLQSVGTPCDVQVDIYNSPGNATPIASVVLNPGVLAAPTWFEFIFPQGATLVPGSMYYLDVFQLLSGYHYEWFFDSGNPYPPGTGWMRGVPTDPYGSPFDWTFKTEYYNPPPHAERREGHYVTCAGVNSQESKIAFSDPTLDVANPQPNDHNDAAFVSHDIYNVTIGSPRPDIDCNWWLSNYNAGYNYTIVEQAIIICPVPDNTPPTLEITKPVKALYFFNREILKLTGGTLIIGKIDVNVTATDDDSGMDRVEFYISLQTLMENDTTAPYSWKWDQMAFFKQTVTIKAFDKEGNMASETIEVWKFF
jgi:hypothetical protein